MAEKKGEVKWLGSTQRQEWKDVQIVVDPKYSKVGERIRHITPSALQCSMFCGGKQCKYDNPAKWKEEEMAFKGLYSTWITDRILAMARPSTYTLNKFDIINQFKKSNISAVINLQHPGEHASCGFGLEDGGFSYVPQQFMDEDVFFYNFCCSPLPKFTAFIWRKAEYSNFRDDYGVRALQSILDMVKVVDFALMDGKVAIHCHAGLGRTGVLIACYFVYSQRLRANAAINAVRAKRPRSIQTRGQIACVRDFETYLRPMWIVYSNTSTEHKSFSLSQFMRRQAHILHGEEERALRYVPKIVFVICQRLLQLAGVDFELRSITVLRRRGFNSLSLTDESKESELLEIQTSADSLKKLSTGHKNKSDSEFVVGHIFEKGESNEDVAIFPGGLADNVYFDSFADGPGEYGGVDELAPEQMMHHSVSESVLMGADKDTRSRSVTTASEPLMSFRDGAIGENDTLERDYDENYTNCETARVADAEEVLMMKIQQPMLVADDISKKDLHNNLDDSLVMINKTSLNSNAKIHSENNNTVSIKQKTPIDSNPEASEEKSVIGQSVIDVNIDVVTENIAASLSPKTNIGKISTKLEKLKHDLNSSESTWTKLENEENAHLLCCLLWNWFEHLEEPVMNESDLRVIEDSEDDPVKAFESLVREKRKTLQVVLLTFLKIASGSTELKDKALRKISMIFTKSTSNPRKTRSEKAALIRDQSNDQLQTTASCFNFLTFIEKLCTTKLFET